ncbi:SET domain-containing protein-lysine N-methyltransferase [Candidatus Woesearchaeota archaeon]|nr:SET domain-containing protein-lysine N-methyltransferase [Candidatus Woesearchaeota archaeon]
MTLNYHLRIAPCTYLVELENRGAAVFANKNIGPGELIEVCPALIFPEKEAKRLIKTDLSQYLFNWGKDKAALALGYGSLYNHSCKPNARCTFDKRRKFIIYQSIDHILQDHEIMINYDDIHGECGDTSWA